MSDRVGLIVVACMTAIVSISSVMALYLVGQRFVRFRSERNRVAMQQMQGTRPGTVFTSSSV